MKLVVAMALAVATFCAAILASILLPLSFHQWADVVEGESFSSMAVIKACGVTASMGLAFYGWHRLAKTFLKVMRDRAGK